MTTMASPGRALRELARKEGWTFEQLADRLSYSHYLTQKLLDDEVPLTATVAGELERATGKPLSEWLGLYTECEQAKTPIGRSLIH